MRAGKTFAENGPAGCLIDCVADLHSLGIVLDETVDDVTERVIGVVL